MKPMPLRRKLAALAVLLLAGMQLVRCEHTNPEVTADIQAPADVKAILRRACYDCHSNESVWPWYSQVAPVSWLVARDVRDGRKHLNFSDWGKKSETVRGKKQAEAGEEIRTGEMPMSIYVPLHPNAKLTDGDKAILDAWARGPVSP
jgi:hypothetical protein